MLRLFIVGAVLCSALGSCTQYEPPAPKAAILKLSNKDVTPIEQSRIAKIYKRCPARSAPCLQDALYLIDLPNQIEFMVVTV